MYVITGATGNTGKIIADKLLAARQKVRVIGRSAERLQLFVAKGAEAFVGSLDDAETMARAFTGAKAVYAMIPPDLKSKDYRADQERTSDALAAGIEKAGVPHVVLLSSFGADKPDKTGPIAGLHNFEQKLNKISALNALYLRPGYFMENLLPQIGVVKSMGMMAGPVKADVGLPMIATRDIGEYAAGAITALNFKGKQTRELQGARDVAMKHAAAIVGAAIGKPNLSYTHAPAMMLKPAMVAMGISANVVDLLLEMSEAINSGYVKGLEARGPENTTPTTLEWFAENVFAPAFGGKAASA
ncbi:MAG TPA: NmrA family NAD(P)-binding protein [Candidatus Acidoferrales bacterium]|nr:NmrA family NAD(P)-binding protein [Candidatus Acidoferrales bacterium]